MALYDFFKMRHSLVNKLSRENRKLEPITIRYDVGHPYTIDIHVQLNPSSCCTNAFQPRTIVK